MDKTIIKIIAGIIAGILLLLFWSAAAVGAVCDYMKGNIKTGLIRKMTGHSDGKGAGMGKIVKKILGFFTDTNGGECEDKNCGKCPFPPCGKEPETEKDSGGGKI